jgi:hypothetical protein
MGQRWDKNGTRMGQQSSLIPCCIGAIPWQHLAIFGAKLRKKLVKVKRFWKINAFRPKIKAIKGKTRNFKLKEKAN